MCINLKEKQIKKEGENMINKINGISITNSYSKNYNNKSSQSTAFSGNMVIKSKSLDIIDEDKVSQVVKNIYDGVFVRGLGIFPEVDDARIDKFAAAKISFNTKYNDKVKKLVNDLNIGMKKAKIEDKMEIKYED